MLKRDPVKFSGSILSAPKVVSTIKEAENKISSIFTQKPAHAIAR